MTPTITNIDRESPTRRTIMKTEMVRWCREQQRQTAEQLRRIHGRED
jgi:hypothetical protein|nr:MAG TPA: hypothetical protein [Bacteriophage sp.]